MGTVRKGSVVVTSLNRDALQQALLREHGTGELARELPPPPFVLASDVAEPEAHEMQRDLAAMGVQAMFEPAPRGRPRRFLSVAAPAGSSAGWWLRLGVRLAVLLVLGVVAFRFMSRDLVANLLDYYGAPQSMVAWVANLPAPSVVSSPAGTPPLAANASRPLTIMDGPATAMRQTFEAQYRLRPDARMLGAFAFLAQASERWAGAAATGKGIGMGEPVQDNATLVIPLVAQESGGRGGTQLGEVRVPQPLQFDAWVKALGQWLDLLAQHGRPLPASTPSTPAETLTKAADLMTTADPLALLDALALLETAWKATGPDARAVRLAGRAYTLLTLTLGDDAAGQADSLASSALGMLALAGRMDPAASTAAECCMLAKAMGYGDAAESLTTVMAATSNAGADSFEALATAFARQDLDALQPHRAGQSLLAAYLLADTAQRSGLWQDLGQILEPLRHVTTPPAPFMAKAIYALPLGQVRGVSEKFPAYVLRLINGWAGTAMPTAQAADDQGLVSFSEFAAAVAAWSPVPPKGAPDKNAGKNAEVGMLVDAHRQRTVLLALYTSALTARHYLLQERLGSLPMTAAFLQPLAGKDAEHPLVMLWRAQHLAQTGKLAEAEQLAGAALATRQLPMELAYTAYTLFDRFPAKCRVAPVVARSLDSRPQGWNVLGRIFYSLGNVDLAAPAYARAVEADGRDFSSVWGLVALHKDDEPFRAAKARYPEDLNLLRMAGDYNKGLHTTEGNRRALEWYTEATRLAPGNVSLNRSKAWVQLRLGRADEAIDTARKVLDQKPEDSLARVDCQACLAEAYLQKNQTAMALEAITGVPESYQAGVMMVAVRIYEATGKAALAETWLQRAVDRYPYAEHVLTGAASYYWRKGDPAKAAAFIQQGRANMGEQFRWYGQAFMQALGKAPKATALAAVDALLATGGTAREIAHLGERYLNGGQPDIALAVLQKAPATRAMETLDRATSVYQAIKTLKDESLARKYLRGVVDKSTRGPFSMILFTHGLYDILLEEYQHPESFGPDYREFIQLVRLLAWLGKDRAPASLEAEFLPHYQQASKDFYHAAGRLFLGIMTEQEFLASIATPKQRCEAAYYLGLHHRLRGDFAQAALWYQICLETGLEHNGEYHWALDELSRWASLGLSRRHRLAGEERRLQASLP